MTIPLKANSHRRQQLRKRILHEETHCAICHQPVNKNLKHIPGQHNKNCKKPHCKGCKPHPQSPEIDEDLPRARGGSPYNRNNCHLTHRHCNQTKGTKTLTEYHKHKTPHTPNPNRTPINTPTNW